MVRAEPTWSLLPKDISPTLLVFLRQCLLKDPRQRIGDIRDVRLALEGAFELPSAPAIPAVAPLVSRSRIAWAALVIVSLAALVWAAFGYFRPAPPAAEAIRFFVSPLDTWKRSDRGRVAVPD